MFESECLWPCALAYESALGSVFRLEYKSVFASVCLSACEMVWWSECLWGSLSAYRSE